MSFPANWMPNKKQDENKVELEKYMDLAFIDAFKAPRESVFQGSFEKGLEVAVLAGYQAELLGRAKGSIKIENDPLLMEDYNEAIQAEKKRLLSRFKDMTEIKPQAYLAYFSICFILKEFEAKKPNTDDAKV